MSMSHEATELELYAVNDGDLHRQRHAPFQKNQVRRWKKGTWEQDQAAQGYKYFVIAAAKKYCKEYCSKDTPWHHIFPKPVRDEVCASLADFARQQLECGAWK